jgi:hypothetical protein
LKVTYIGIKGDPGTPPEITAFGHTFALNVPMEFPEDNAEAVERLRKNPTFTVEGNFHDADAEAKRVSKVAEERARNAEIDYNRAQSEARAQEEAKATAHVAAEAAVRAKLDAQKKAQDDADMAARMKLTDQQVATSLARQTGKAK